MQPIRKIAVIGSGVMGGGIAAQAANAGIPVLLFDMTKDVATDSIERLRKTSPDPLMIGSNAELITPCGIDRDMSALQDCDWIVEAIIERPDAKQDLYAKIERVCARPAIVSSNTSTIPLSDLMRDAPLAFRKKFLITHFFNPPRHMRLLEIVAGPDTDEDVIGTISEFADRMLGKSIVHCKDRPGFIANRLGCFWLQAAISEAFAQELPVEDADAVMGKSFGFPKTGVFGLADLIGIDLLPQVNASLANALGKDDLFHSVNVPLPLVDAMVINGQTGRKGKGGFYRLNRAAGKRKEVIDLTSGQYREVHRAEIDGGSPILLQDNPHGCYARSVMLKMLAYAALLVGDAADDIASIDAAMRLGYNWKWGPFELIDRIGITTFRNLADESGLPLAPVLTTGDEPLYRNGSARTSDGVYRPLVRANGIILLEDFKGKTPPLQANGSASLWDLGDGVACFELTSKMNTFDEDVFELLNRSIDRIPQTHNAMVIYSDAANFSAGINLNWLLSAMADGQSLESLSRRGQDTFHRLKYAAFPTVGGSAGLALGGGCELLLHCSAIQAHAESCIGLVEASVGILPAWGGCGELLYRLQCNQRLAQGPMPAITRAFETLAMSVISKSAAHAKELSFISPGDGITMNRDRLLADCKAKALQLAVQYHPPEKPVFMLPGLSGLTALQNGAETMVKLDKASAHDLAVAAAIATVLTGGDTDITQVLTEDALLALERREVLNLARSPLTIARLNHTLNTGKSLRN